MRDPRLSDALDAIPDHVRGKPGRPRKAGKDPAPRPIPIGDSDPGLAHVPEAFRKPAKPPGKGC